jgi:hypothetical protein
MFLRRLFEGLDLVPFNFAHDHADMERALHVFLVIFCGARFAWAKIWTAVWGAATSFVLCVTFGGTALSCLGAFPHAL